MMFIFVEVFVWSVLIREEHCGGMLIYSRYSKRKERFNVSYAILRCRGKR